jgi:hypothetical protein
MEVNVWIRAIEVQYGGTEEEILINLLEFSRARKVEAGVLLVNRGDGYNVVIKGDLGDLFYQISCVQK